MRGKSLCLIFSHSFQVFVSNLNSDKLWSLEINRSVYMNSAIFPLALLVLITSAFVLVSKAAVPS